MKSLDLNYPVERLPPSKKKTDTELIIDKTDESNHESKPRVNKSTTVAEIPEMLFVFRSYPGETIIEKPVIVLTYDLTPSTQVHKFPDLRNSRTFSGKILNYVPIASDEP